MVALGPVRIHFAARGSFESDSGGLSLRLLFPDAGHEGSLGKAPH